MTGQGIPLPIPTPLSEPFWDACRRSELLVQRCDDCGAHQSPPQPCCTACFSGDLAWVPSSGRGSIYSYTVVWRPQQPAFDVPYIDAIVEMEEGWHTLTTLIDCDPAAVEIGMPVEVSFRPMSGTITLPYFRPVETVQSPPNDDRRTGGI